MGLNNRLNLWSVCLALTLGFSGCSNSGWTKTKELTPNIWYNDNIICKIWTQDSNVTVGFPIWKTCDEYNRLLTGIITIPEIDLKIASPLIYYEEFQSNLSKSEFDLDKYINSIKEKYSIDFIDVKINKDLTNRIYVEIKYLEWWNITNIIQCKIFFSEKEKIKIEREPDCKLNYDDSFNFNIEDFISLNYDSLILEKINIKNWKNRLFLEIFYEKDWKKYKKEQKILFSDIPLEKIKEIYNKIYNLSKIDKIVTFDIIIPKIDIEQYDVEWKYNEEHIVNLKTNEDFNSSLYLFKTYFNVNSEIIGYEEENTNYWVILKVVIKNMYGSYSLLEDNIIFRDY